MKTFSFPRPERPAQRRCPRPPRDLLPLEAIPDDSNLPSLPSPPRKFSDPSYTLTTHLVPVALPRSTPEVPLPATSARVATDAGAVSLAKELIAIRDSYWDGELNLPNSTKPLWACVNRYVRRDINNVDGGKGVTLVLAHANGYHKEIWEPTIAHMIRAQNNSSSQVQIDEEAMTYTDMLTMYETWDLIDDLDERVELRWILAGKIGKGEEWFRETTSWRRPANSSNVVFSQAGHLIVMEAPEELGKDIFSFIEHKSNPLHSKL
ncbi:hypothetical protein EVJ58_g8117 [Rhodofomes roseus]|uniref:Uncharacterized protein n=1 Tax=Rhodofomes roseus TaxID=34475 RepID=A0A4Y9Y1P3_9APHY|nr:hypothetical protein EVJ58_g8117 [Rhodofomes roseus]